MNTVCCSSRGRAAVFYLAIYANEKLPRQNINFNDVELAIET